MLIIRVETHKMLARIASLKLYDLGLNCLSRLFASVQNFWMFSSPMHNILNVSCCGHWMSIIGRESSFNNLPQTSPLKPLVGY